MLTGLDPFTKLTDTDPMGIYKRILEGKIKFPKNFPKAARDLVKKLVTADLSKRLGNLKSGSEGVLGHAWYNEIKFVSLENKLIKPPYVPKVESESDTKNFEDYPESEENVIEIKEDADPFLQW
jgi:serine/threonine protein kinase